MFQQPDILSEDDGKNILRQRMKHEKIQLVKKISFFNIAHEGNTWLMSLTMLPPGQFPIPKANKETFCTSFGFLLLRLYLGLDQRFVKYIRHT